MKIFVHILNWNDYRYLPDLFASIEKQSDQDFTLRILDNGSTDESTDYIKQYFSRALVGKNVKNMGFVGGHNQLLQFTLDHLDSDVDPHDVGILIANSDMIWDEDIIRNFRKAFEENSGTAAFQPKLYRAFEDFPENDILGETVKSDILDTTGLRISKNMSLSDRGAGELDKGQYDNVTDIFGATGTMSLFRLSTLVSVMESGSMYDKEFFAYKEDCDLAWRLKRAGWKSLFVPSARAYHYRGMYGAEKQSLLSRLKNRKGQRPFFAALSTRNQILLLIKNLSISNAIIHAPWILFSEVTRISYGFLFEKYTRSRLMEIWKLLPAMLKKRKLIFKTAVLKSKEIRAYVTKN